MEKPKLKIMLIEDDAGDVELIREQLKDMPTKSDLLTFTNGKDAINYLESQIKEPTGSSQGLPQLIVLDLRLPGEHGLDILTRVKGHEMLQSIPVIVNTGSEDPEHLRQAYKRGGTFFMRKSCDLAALGEVIMNLRISGLLKA